MSDLIDLGRRVVLVTGAGQGVGREIALQCARHGAGAVVVNDFHAERAAAVADEVRSLGATALARACDVTDYDDVVAMFEAARAEVGPVDVLVNNAGNAGPTFEIGDPPAFWETGPEDWAPWMGTNLFGVMNCCRVGCEGMVTREYGRIVTLVSDAAAVGDGRFAAYSAAKAGAAGFIRALARAVGPHGITANCVSLGAIETPGLAARRSDPERVKRQLRRYVIPRLGQPVDAAAAVLFLASDAASWVTGQTWAVNGGYAV